jgi:hypothetical protein
MKIQIEQPELEAQIRERMQQGAFPTVRGCPLAGVEILAIAVVATGQSRVEWSTRAHRI